jgi:hypothetical protein
MVIALTVLAFTGILLTLAWMSPLTVSPMANEALSITDMQFSKGCLTLTVKNVGVSAATINEAMVNQISTQHTVPLHEPIAAGKQISIRVSFNWASGYTYRVGLVTARGNSFFQVAAAP